MGNCASPSPAKARSLSALDQERRAKELELIAGRDTAKSVVSEEETEDDDSRSVGSSIWYVLDRSWLNSWLNYTATGENGPRPGPIDNSCLLHEVEERGGGEEEGEDVKICWKIKPWLVMDKEDEPGDYRVVKKRVWEAFLDLYGGGPEIHVEGEMIEVDDVNKWVFDNNWAKAGGDDEEGGGM